ncbi:Concanavalin A-like lectin/glucanases superfamily protein [Lentzea fradiae]|uniref:Concanavalin A-like lectin/glucanases superfamily protein n=1 Tax=Lentzea fradiae TaxID=200378 RepID=A0A1G8DP32_9PSEU|nr:LamG-like jellyroll fold domain-containing protein [Lentzea fradiae]SDH59150.1 Concanavalin A-like lectin/glucanases superfamily protein [Lentzea fradiae]
MRIARGRGFVLPVLSAAIVAGGMIVGSVASVAAEVPDEVPDAVSAERLAEQSGKSVVIGSETTETSQVRANPDGSRTLTNHVHPVRVKKNEQWTAVDLDLAVQPDGTLAPKAAPVAMSFTAGGAGSAERPVARLIKGDAEVGFGWGTDLPPVRINGKTATYPDVLPGVDLEVEAALTGFAQNLVVKSAEAAQQSALQKITFKSHTKNTRIEKATTPGPASRSATTESGGGLVVTGPDGEQVFGGDASRMWDSSEGARQGVMAVEVGADSISVTPDQSFLLDPATTYPVRLDPDYYCTSCGKQHHAVVQSPWPTASNFDATSGQLGDLKAGYLNASSLGASSAGISRSYFQMNTSSMTGKKIKSATMKTRILSSYSCSPSPTELWLTGGIDHNTRWNNQPGWEWGAALSENNNRNNPAHCATDGGAEFNATSAVAAAAAGAWSTTTFMLKAKNESDLNNSWRRFDLNPYLEVTYNSYPLVPVDLGLEGWGPGANDAIRCATGPTRPLVGTRTPRVRARLSDPDGGMTDARFQFKDGLSPGGPWTGPEIYMNDVPSGSFVEVRVPDNWFTHDGIWTFNLTAGDGELSGPRSEDCEFEVDTIKPNIPAVSSTDYPATGSSGSVGHTGIFRFSPAGNTGRDGTMDVVRYGWSLNSDTTDNQVLVTEVDGVMDVAITPTKEGPNVLYVRAYDQAGNIAAEPQKYLFTVAAPTNPVAAWTFDDATGGTVADVASGNHPLTLNGGASLASGYSGSAQTGNGGTHYSATSGPVVDTSHAFSLSAWVKLDHANYSAAVAGQDGNFISSFFLQYSVETDRWAMTLVSPDQIAPPTIVRAVSAAPPQLGVWTHLVGTYEPNSREVSLYVNGKLEGTTTADVWPAGGPFVVGAGKRSGDRVDHFPGLIDHVQVWNRLLTPTEAARENNLVVLRAHYNLDERTGTETKDEVTGQNAAVSGSTSWAGTPVDPDDPNQILTSIDKWMNFGAPSTGQVVGPRPVNLRTDRSYTVTAWARLAEIDGTSRAVVSMGDATHSPFILGVHSDGGGTKWSMELTRTPSGDGRYALSDIPAEADTWVHLAATFDATSGTVALYVNGVKQNTFDGPSTGQESFNASGELLLGRDLWSGVASEQWKGDVDDVRIYSGVLSTADVDAIRASTIHF